VSASTTLNLTRRVVGNNVWLCRPESRSYEVLAGLSPRSLDYEVVETEEAVGRAMLGEIENVANARPGDVVIILLGGRGAQALHRLLGELASTSQIDALLSRLHVFTQDAIAPLRMESAFSFVRDFERLLGDAFFEKIKSFTPIQTNTEDVEAELSRYVQKLESMGGVDIFFLGHGPEPGGASHLAYIRAGSGAVATDLAGVIPISAGILDHHITKFKAGGSAGSEADEAECRRATHILTLGPAAILGARRIVQSIVDARTAPAKRQTYRRVLEASIAVDPGERAAQLDQNPGLWVRLHPNVRSLILPDVLA
jgi:6-phosphogluconolactonase/glucosamine-6-phosphate isomerase/deaminase